jgi:transcriptional regulator with XRE-family HTH domain
MVYIPYGIYEYILYFIVMGNKGTYLEQQLRDAFRQSGWSIYRLAKDSGVSQPVVSRFVNEKRGITLATASKLAEVLGLELVSKKKKAPANKGE